ncbi:tetratricopeptide repeat protein [Rhodocyclaceae bacterium SMB388]
MVLLAVISLAYWPGLHGGFVFDDFPNFVRNDALILQDTSAAELLRVAFAGEAGPLARPLAMLSFALERHFFGLMPGPMKVTNLLIHLVNTLLAFQLLQGILKRASVLPAPARPLSVPAGALALPLTAAWALAPINLTGVLFVVQRMESLATLFMLGGLVVWLHGRLKVDAGDGRGWYWVLAGIVGGTGFGAMAKEVAVMLPVYALLLEWLLFGLGSPGSSTRRRMVQLYGLILLLPALAALAMVLPGILSGGAFAERPFGLAERLMTQSRVLWLYLSWTIAPQPGEMSLYHDGIAISRGVLQPWTTLAAIAGLAILVATVIAIRRQFPLVTLGVLWFFVAHLLVSTILPLELVYEHRNYLSSMGLLLALIALMFSGRNQPSLNTARWTFVVALIALFGLFTHLRAHEWSDPVKLAYFEASRKADSPRANYELGRVLFAVAPGPDSPQFSFATRSFEHAANLPNGGLLPYQGLIFAHAKVGRPVKEQWWNGMESYIARERLSVQDIGALHSLLSGQIEGTLSLDVDQLGRLLQHAMREHAHRAILVTLYANYLLNIRKDFDAGEQLLQGAVAMAPRNPQIWQNLIEFQVATGQMTQANVGMRRLRELNSVGRLDPVIVALEQRIAQREAGMNNIGTDRLPLQLELDSR